MVPSRTCALDGYAEGMCEVGYHEDYVRTAGMLVWFTCYTIVHARLGTLAFASLLCSGVGIVVLFMAQR